MQWIAALIFAVVLSMHASAHAAPADHPVRDMPRVPGSDIETIGTCVRQVREGTSDQKFDAYIRQSGGLRVTGTDDEVRRFTACLRGEPTSNATTDPSVSPMPRPHSRHRDAASREPTAKPSTGRRP